MLKRNWKTIFVGISQLVDILATLASAEDSAPEAHKCASFLAHQPLVEDSAPEAHQPLAETR